MATIIIFNNMNKVYIYERTRHSTDTSIIGINFDSSNISIMVCYTSASYPQQ